MALTNSFTASQNIGAPSVIAFTDTSTGSDSNVIERRIYLTKEDGSALVPTGTVTSYIVWPLASTSYNVKTLDKDYALRVNVQWWDAGAALYSSLAMYVFTLYNQEFDFSLTSLEASRQSSINDGNWYDNRLKLRVEIDNAQQAVLLTDGQTNAQSACDRATHLRLNQSLFF